MIENLRRYTGLIIVAVALVFFGLVFLGQSSLRRSAAAGGTFIVVDGRGYTQTDFTKLGKSSLGLTTGMLSNTAAREFYSVLVAGVSPEMAEQRFFAGRMLIRQARDQFGVHPSDDEIREFVEELPMFQAAPAMGAAPGTPGEFDPQLYNDFIDKGLGRFGMVERDFHELIRDMIATSKLREIIGGGLPVDRSLAEANVVVSAQQLQLGVAPLDLKAIREGIQPTDEELQAYWETIKDAYMTEKRIKVSYLLIAPEYPEENAEDSATAENDGEPAQEEEKPDPATVRAEADQKLKRVIGEFVKGLYTSEGREFDSLLKANGWTPTSTDWFTASTLPAELNLKTHGAYAGKTISGQLFSRTLGPDPLAPFTEALAVGENQWFIGRLDELEDPRVKTFEEAREEVLERYKEEKAHEAAEAQAKEKIAAIQTGLDAGKPFADAAKEAGLEGTELGPFAISDSLDGAHNPRQLFSAAATTNPGDFADPLFLEDQVLLIHVIQRQIVKDDSRSQRVDFMIDSSRGSNMAHAFQAWLDQRLVEAGISGPGSR